jgi:hypothetical protein
MLIICKENGWNDPGCKLDETTHTVDGTSMTHLASIDYNDGGIWT